MGSSWHRGVGGWKNEGKGLAKYEKIMDLWLIVGKIMDFMGKYWKIIQDVWKMMENVGKNMKHIQKRGTSKIWGKSREVWKIEANKKGAMDGPEKLNTGNPRFS